jgi:hypothetical protein
VECREGESFIRAISSSQRSATAQQEATSPCCPKGTTILSLHLHLHLHPHLHPFQVIFASTHPLAALPCRRHALPRPTLRLRESFILFIFVPSRTTDLGVRARNAIACHHGHQLRRGAVVELLPLPPEFIDAHPLFFAFFNHLHAHVQRRLVVALHSSQRHLLLEPAPLVAALVLPRALVQRVVAHVRRHVVLPAPPCLRHVTTVVVDAL